MLPVLRCYKEDKSSDRQMRVAVAEAGNISGTQKKGKWGTSTILSRYQKTGVDTAG
jgi:hypothetical protein